MKQGILQKFDENEELQLGGKLHRFASELYPICRSITGAGIRETLARIQERIPLSITEVPTGTEVFDWTVPKEWNIRDAYIKDANGKRLVDFQRHNLHVVGYSTPIAGKFSFDELRPHLHTLPEHPDWIPYRTSYYKEDWGFCLTDLQLLELKDGTYDVRIDATLDDGHLVYGECLIPGRSSEEVLISVHACHPSLANDNLSGVTVATALAEYLLKRDLQYSYRFLFIPGTIGAITWLARNREAARLVRGGLVLTCIGDAGGFHYKKSRQGSTEIDRTTAHVLGHSGEPAEVLEFSPYGYDERQYCSPGFNLPVGCLMRSVWGTFPEYHTSADNLAFIHPRQLAKSLRVILSICDVLERNSTYLNQKPFCEPQLGKRNLYRSTGGAGIDQEIHARLWVLNQSDGEHSLMDIADRSGIPFAAIADAAALLEDAGLLKEVTSAQHNIKGRESRLNLSVG
jgi:aminopeptidase-like protein